MNDDSKKFERALRAWGDRPPRMRAESAATRVLSQLPPQPRSFAPHRLFPAAAAIVVLIGAGWLATREVETPPPLRSAPTAAAIQAPALGDNVVLWWLDPETPVYFVLKSPNHH